jgi:hypothetical protein
MKRIFLISVILVLLSITSVYGEQIDEDSDVFVFFRFGYLVPAENVLKNNIAVEAGSLFPVAKRLFIEPSILFTQLESINDLEVNVDTLGSGDLTIARINLNLNYDLFSMGRLTAYASVGVGYLFNFFAPLESYSELGLEIEEEMDNSIGINLGLGFNYSISKSFVINLYAGYLFSSAESEWSVKDPDINFELTSISETSLNNLSILLGIRIGL